MINISKDNFKKLKKIYNDSNVEESAIRIREMFTKHGEKFSIFTIMSMLDTMVILFDDKDNEPLTRYISFSGDEIKNYLVLNASRTIEELRFDAACMLKELARTVSNGKKNFCLNRTTINKKFSREDKHFACSLLMPKDELMEVITRKDEKGNYLYLDNKMQLSFKSINEIASYFGVPFGPCSSRIFHVFEDLKYESKKNKYTIEGAVDKKEYKKLKDKYLKDHANDDLKEIVLKNANHRNLMIEHLVDCLHYRSWDKMSEIAKRKLLVSLVKHDSVNEGVVKSEEEAKEIINNYIASGGSIYDGNLITKDKEIALSDEQLVVLGEYELYTKTLERGLIRGIAKSNPKLNFLNKLSYKEAINSINERDLSNYICDLHSRLFSKLSYKYGENRGGFYRDGPVKLKGTGVETAHPRMIPQLMDNLSWRILEILKKNVNGNLSNSQYIKEINECIYDMIRMQPFGDGNKRTSRLLSNILYQEKGIPYVIVPVKEWDNYVEAWSYDNVSKYNDLMYKMILDSYKYFYGTQSVNGAVNNKLIGQKIIMDNREVKR